MVSRPAWRRAPAGGVGAITRSAPVGYRTPSASARRLGGGRSWYAFCFVNSGIFSKEKAMPSRQVRRMLIGKDVGPGAPPEATVPGAV